MIIFIKRVILSGGLLISFSCTLEAGSVAGRWAYGVSSVNVLPTQDFYVLPVDPQLLTQRQILEWDAEKGDFHPFGASFDVKSTAGAIRVYLDTSDMSSRTAEVSLVVQLDQNKLSSTAVEVVNQADAQAGKRVWLNMWAERPVGGYKVGVYSGNITMVFDAVMPFGA